MSLTATWWVITINIIGKVHFFFFYLQYLHLLNAQATRHLSQIYHLRSFNNWIKAEIIKTAQQLSADMSVKESTGRRPQGFKHKKFDVLDLGCGMGGDILKWMGNQNCGKWLIEIFICMHASMHTYMYT